MANTAAFTGINGLREIRRSPASHLAEAFVTGSLPGTVELIEPTATPSGPVGPAGCATVLPFPLTVNLTTAPGTGTPAASRTMMVMIAMPLPT